MRRFLATGVLTAMTAATLAPAAAAAIRPNDEFFIVSSIDPPRSRLLLKRPTEVTEVMRVDRSTQYRDEGGRPIALSDLRAGDTVFIRSTPGTGGALALEIRKGPMTVAELHRRYLAK